MNHLEKVRKEAIEVFGSEVTADHWLKTYHTVFDNEPIKLLDTPEGVIEVMKVLSSIKYGGVV